MKVSRPPGRTSVSGLAGGVYESPVSSWTRSGTDDFRGLDEPGAGALLAEARRSTALNLKGEGCGSAKPAPLQARIRVRW
jgi:hypothetical protein